MRYAYYVCIGGAYTYYALYYVHMCLYMRVLCANMPPYKQCVVVSAGISANICVKKGIPLYGMVAILGGWR